MAIGGLTDHVSGQLMNLATLVGNNTLIEQYLAGLIDPADFQDLITKAHGVRGQHHRVYIGTPFDANINPGSHRIKTQDHVGGGGEDPSTIALPTDLDLKAQLDISVKNAAYGHPLAPLIANGIWSNVTWPNEVGLTSRRTCLIWERLGKNPTATGGIAGYPTPLLSYEHSWHNWRWDGDLLGDFHPGGVSYAWDLQEYVYENYLMHQQDDADRFYYDRWMTVPHCSKRIWIPEPCVLIVVASAYGTCNSSLGGRVTGNGVGSPGEDLSANTGTWPAGHVGPQTDRSNEFRLFLDSDGRPSYGSPSWSWRCGEAKLSNHRTLATNWIPHTNTTDQPSTGINITSMPRSRFTVAHEFKVPAAGYYNISMRYSSNYFYGALTEPGVGRNPDDVWNEYYAGYGMADHWIARWEHAQIGALAVFGQSDVENNAASDGHDTYTSFNLT
jgi:hypothetical protein